MIQPVPTGAAPRSACVGVWPEPPPPCGGPSVFLTAVGRVSQGSASELGTRAGGQEAGGGGQQRCSGAARPGLRALELKEPCTVEARAELGGSGLR